MDLRSIMLFSKACTFGIGLTLVTSCADDHNGRINVPEANKLGVASLQIDRLEDHGNAVFVLTAFSAGQEELASVRLSKGQIAELEPLRDGSTLGAALDIAVGPAITHAVTRSTERIDLDLGTREPATVDFLTLATVTTTLAREANIFVGEKPSTESGYPLNPQNKVAESCPRQYMNTTPVAKQCCLSTDTSNGQGFTYHVGVKGTGNAPPTFAQEQTIVYRQKSPYGLCRTQNGDDHCSGTACYFGPNGFAIPVQLPPATGVEYGKVNRYAVTGGTQCYPSSQLDPVTQPHWGDVIGTFANGYGCCGGVRISPTEGCCADAIYSTTTHHCCTGVITPNSTSCGIGDQNTGANGAWD